MRFSASDGLKVRTVGIASKVGRHTNQEISAGVSNSLPLRSADQLHGMQSLGMRGWLRLTCRNLVIGNNLRAGG